MPCTIREVLSDARSAIARNWAQRAQQASPGYRALELSEIEAGGLALVDALCEAVDSGNYEPMEEALRLVAERRISSGVAARDIERVLVMGCDVILPFLEQAYKDDARSLVYSVTQVERGVHRSLELLAQVVRDMEVDQAQAAVADLEAAGAAFAVRVQAVLDAMGHGAVAVNREGIVVWADEKARSARCGVVRTGDSVLAPAGANPDMGLIARALETGQVHRGRCQSECDVCYAIPVRDEKGEVVEVIGILGPGPGPADCEP